MQQLTYVKKGCLEWREAPSPTLRAPKEAIVRPFIAARCDGDAVPLFRHASAWMQAGLAAHLIDPMLVDVMGKRPFAGPFAFGHECIAEVLECGADVATVRPGDQVIVPWSISCGECTPCHDGLTSRCANGGDTLLSGYGFGATMGPWGGAVSDALRVPFADSMLVKIPDGVDPVILASASDNLPDGWRAVGPQLRRRPGAPVLVVGGSAKSIGLYAAGIAGALGASRVAYLDFSRERLEIAAALGATPMEMPRSQRWLHRHAPRAGGPYLISVDASSTAAGLEYAIRSLAPGGVCMGVGYYLARGTSLPLLPMYVNSSSLHIGVSNPRADLPDVLDLVQKGSFKPEKVTSLVADWSDAPQAFLERTTKVVVKRKTVAASSNGASDR